MVYPSVRAKSARVSEMLRNETSAASAAAFTQGCSCGSTYGRAFYYDQQCPGGCLALVGGRYRCSSAFTSNADERYCPYN